jgi:IMP dehydrogenase
MSNLPPEEAFSFDDVLLIPSYSDVLPKDVNVGSQLTKNLALNIPFASAAMDTVTEAETSISMAREGGIGFIHRNMSIKSQAVEVDKVKKSESGMIGTESLGGAGINAEVPHIRSSGNKGRSIGRHRDQQRFKV